MATLALIIVHSIYIGQLRWRLAVPLIMRMCKHHRDVAGVWQSLYPAICRSIECKVITRSIYRFDRLNVQLSFIFYFVLNNGLKTFLKPAHFLLHIPRRFSSETHKFLEMHVSLAFYESMKTATEFDIWKVINWVHCNYTFRSAEKCWSLIVDQCLLIDWQLTQDRNDLY